VTALVDVAAVAAIMAGLSGLVAILRWDRKACATLRDLERRIRAASGDDS
jgi:hypothetical protein